MVSQVEGMLDVLKSLRLSTRSIEKELGFSNGLLRKGGLSKNKIDKLTEYFLKFSKEGDQEFCYHIYKLIDPRTNELFYVGQTRQTLKHRLIGHISEHKTNLHIADRMSKKCKIVYEIIKTGLSPRIESLEEIKGKCLVDLYLKACEREAYWVAILNPIGNEVKCLRRRETRIAHSQTKYRKNEFKKIKSIEEANRAISYYKSKITAQDDLLLEYKKIIEERDARISELEAQISTQSQNKVSVQNLTETAKTSNYSINTQGRPERKDGESGIDYSIRLAEWKESIKMKKA